MTDPRTALVSTGGVLRCCLKTLQEAEDSVLLSEVVPCQWCDDGMAFFEDIWQARWYVERRLKGK